MHELDTRSRAVTEPASALRTPGSDSPVTVFRQLAREVGNRAMAGIVSSKLPRPARPPGADEFAKLLGDLATSHGQFTFTTALKQRLDATIDPHLRALPEADRNWVRGWLDHLEAETYKSDQLSTAKTLTLIKTHMRELGTPAGDAIANLMGDPTETGIGFGGSLYIELWREYGKPGAAAPDLSKRLTYAKLTGLHIYENIACKETTSRLGAKVAAGRGGAGKRNPGTAIAKGTNIAADIKRDKTNTNNLVRGDVVVYGTDLPKWIERMRAALDDGWTVHARCISGTWGGSKSGRDPDHSVLIYGHGGNEFYFFDPDIGGTGGLTPGWGRIHYDATAGRLSTAKSDADFATYWYSDQASYQAGSAAGHESNYQASGLHRYQVKEIWTM